MIKDDYLDKRHYQRSGHFECAARISEDGNKWFDAVVHDLSSGGLSFLHEKEYQKGDVLWFDILVQGFFSEFDVKTRGKVCRAYSSGNQFGHGIAFIGLSEDIKIRIDENVKRDRPIGQNPYMKD